jgi:Ca-activated chloride channel family protein
LLLVLDVSPSMRLQDAGPAGKQSRAQRSADVLRSFFERAPIGHYKISVLAVFTEAKPVVIDTTDMEVVRNILTDLPLQYAFKKGPTDLFAGLAEAAKMARPWRPRSTTVLVISDGDTVPATGIPQMPDAVANVLVVGVGDPVTGKFIEGHQSRQDASTLRQVAIRLGGTYHNGNEKHLSSDLVARLSSVPGEGLLARLTAREYALIAVTAGSSVLALLPWALHWFGTHWRPGTRPRPAAASSEAFVQQPKRPVSLRS